MKSGDCLFLPSLWIHQVRSKDRNIAVNYWLEHERAINAEIDRETCESLNSSDFFTLETMRWPSIKNDIGLFRNFLMNLVNDGLVNNGHWLSSLSLVKFLLGSIRDVFSFFFRNSISTWKTIRTCWTFSTRWKFKWEIHRNLNKVHVFRCLNYSMKIKTV